MGKQYKFGFDVWALGLFLLVMLPNFIWFAVPAPNDILRGDSVTGTLDAVGSVCQAAMVAALVVVRNRGAGRGFTRLCVLAGICVLLYYASWAAYYGGLANAAVIVGLTVPPCLAFLLYAAGRRNIVALIPACIFAVCHGIYAVCNFLL